MTMGLEEDELGRAEADRKAGVSCEGSKAMLSSTGGGRWLQPHWRGQEARTEATVWPELR